jgi:hypothetical protein
LNVTTLHDQHFSFIGKAEAHYQLWSSTLLQINARLAAFNEADTPAVQAVGV